MKTRHAFVRTAVTLVLLTPLQSLADVKPSPPRPGDVVFETGFNTEAERAQWDKADFADWVPSDTDNQSLRITVPVDKATSGHMVSMPIDLTPYRGCTLAFECRAKADQVSKPSASYLGVKYMLYYPSTSLGKSWHNENGVEGTFDWRKLEFIVAIAPDAEAGILSLGLQGSSGTIWFDDLRITVLKGPRPPRPQALTNPPPAFKGHNLPRLRGVMSPNAFREEDLRILGETWNANVIRWQLTRNWGSAGTERDLEDYTAWIDGKLDELDKVLEACHRYGIKVVVDIHSPPGGRYENKDMALFFEKPYQDYFIALWERIATRYKGNSAIWGYDLLNEPTQTKPSPLGLADSIGTQILAAKAIRKIDPETPIFITSSQWGSPEGFKDLDPVDVTNIIYQVHFYSPHAFTHQGVYEEWMPTQYPSIIQGIEWNKDQIRTSLQPVRDFQLAYNVHIYVGEFSAIRWAPGAVDYLRDCIDVFESYGWDWTYHAYREWDGWSIEHGSDPKDKTPTQDPTDRKKLLLDWFSKNMKAVVE